MRLKTQNGNFLIFSETHKHAVYYSTREGCEESREGEYPGKILRVLRPGEREFKWAKKTWEEEPRPLSEAEKKLLERTALFRRNVIHIAIKNPKSESSVLRESEFFKTNFGLLISRAHGITYRRIHQGTNGWNLFSLEGPLPKRPSEDKKEGWADFGTYGGVGKNIKWLYPSDLIPITKAEWEAISGRPWVLDHEFSWFKSPVEREVLPAGSLMYGSGDVRCHSRVAKTKIAAERAGYGCFEPVKDLHISTETGEILPYRNSTLYMIDSAVGLEFLKNDPRFDVYYGYNEVYGNQSLFSKTPFTVKSYCIIERSLRVHFNRVESWSSWCCSDTFMFAVLKGTKLSEEWQLVTSEIFYFSKKLEWDRIKLFFPHWKEYKEGEYEYDSPSI